MDPAGTSSRPDLEAVRQRRIRLRVSTEHLKTALASAVGDPTGGSCADILGPALDLQRCLAMHIEATEGPDGFHSEMLATAPRLAHDVRILVREHSQLAAMLSDIVSRSGQQATAGNIDAIQRIGTSLFPTITRHLQHGSDLVYEAYESDLGGET
jgi:hypothetical protein